MKKATFYTRSIQIILHEQAKAINHSRGGMKNSPILEQGARYNREGLPSPIAEGNEKRQRRHIRNGAPQQTGNKNGYNLNFQKRPNFVLNSTTNDAFNEKDGHTKTASVAINAACSPLLSSLSLSDDLTATTPSHPHIRPSTAR